MSVVAIDTSRNVRKTVLLTHEQAEELEAFRLSLRPTLRRIPSESAALAELVKRALDAWREQQKPARKR